MVLFGISDKIATMAISCLLGENYISIKYNNEMYIVYLHLESLKRRIPTGRLGKEYWEANWLEYQVILVSRIKLLTI